MRWLQTGYGLAGNQRNPSGKAKFFDVAVAYPLFVCHRDHNPSLNSEQKRSVETGGKRSQVVSKTGSLNIDGSSDTTTCSAATLSGNGRLDKNPLPGSLPDDSADAPFAGTHRDPYWVG